jgi:hypothetical protein
MYSEVAVLQAPPFNLYLLIEEGYRLPRVAGVAGGSCRSRSSGVDVPLADLPGRGRGLELLDLVGD